MSKVEALEEEIMDVESRELALSTSIKTPEFKQMEIQVQELVELQLETLRFYLMLLRRQLEWEKR